MSIGLFYSRELENGASEELWAFLSFSLLEVNGNILKFNLSQMSVQDLKGPFFSYFTQSGFIFWKVLVFEEVDQIEADFELFVRNIVEKFDIDCFELLLERLDLFFADLVLSDET